MTAKRRLGAQSSATRAALMDGVEAVMREDGYGALTARHVAEKAGLKHQLVYYYFQTLDDLLIATYDRHIEQYLRHIEEAMQSDAPLHAFWAVHSNPVDSVLNVEFLALANHNAAIRRKTIVFGEHVRKIGLERIEGRLRQHGESADALSAFGITMALSAIGAILGLEKAIGISGGHKETREMLDWCLSQLEPASNEPKKS